MNNMNILDVASTGNLINIGFYFGLACLVIFPIMMMIYISFAKKQDHVPFHYRNCFPYEAFVDREKKQDILARVLQSFVLIISLVPALFSMIAFAKETSDINFTLYNAFFLVVSALTAACFALISIIPLRQPRNHLIIYFAFIASIIIKKTVGGLTLLQLGNQFTDVAKILGIVALATLVVDILLLINPKLKNWDKLERITNKKGEEVLARPKWFVLAYSEWIAFGVSAIVDILLLVGVFLAKTSI